MRTHRRTRVISTALIAGTLSVFGVVVTSGTAHAEPYDCSATAQADKAAAYCDNGTGKYRVIAQCDGQSSIRRGPEQRPGTPSVLICPDGKKVVGVSWEITEW